MKINNKKNHLFRVKFFLIMLLFAMCITINVLFCCNPDPYELSDKTTAIETQTTSESSTANEDSDHPVHFKASFINKNHSHTETIAKNTCPILMIAVIPKESGPPLFLIIVFLFFFLTLFILLPDGWTLINQKIRLDN